MFKRCTTCKTNRPLNLFSKLKKSSDGLRGRCNICRKEVEWGPYKKRNAELRKIWYSKKENKASADARAAEWIKNNPERRKEISSKSKRRHRGTINSHTAKRHAQRLNATPPWLTKEHFEQIKMLYKEAARLTKETGIIYNVDHIIPLNNKTVCGLHVPWNLQILTKQENERKGNRL